MADINQDRELLERIRAGDKTACDDCIRVHSPGIYRLALRLMRDQSDAEDVVQEAFLSAFKGIDRFDGRSGLSTWLYRIAFNAAMMRLRRRRPEFVPVETSDETEGDLPIPEALVDWCLLPEQELVRAEAREEMERAIGELPPKLRAVFVMRELEELSTEEAAQALGLSEQAVKTRLHRARLFLRERLTGYFAAHGSGSR
jgi:RNA polymerase sigma-70 factor (ECF subfamily)